MMFNWVEHRVESFTNLFNWLQPKTVYYSVQKYLSEKKVRRGNPGISTKRHAFRIVLNEPDLSMYNFISKRKLLNLHFLVFRSQKSYLGRRFCLSRRHEPPCSWPSWGTCWKPASKEGTHWQSTRKNRFSSSLGAAKSWSKWTICTRDCNGRRRRVSCVQ